MRKIFFLLFFPLTVAAQDSIKHWKVEGASTLQFNQVHLSHWIAGGESSIALTGRQLLSANFNKNKNSWNNSLQLMYGVIKTMDDPWHKIHDQLELQSKYGRSFAKHWKYAAFLNLITQVAPGYDYQNDPEGTDYVSNFMAPGYLMGGLGIDFVSDSIGLSLMASPLTGKQTYILDNGVDETAYGLDAGEKVRNEFGASLNAKIKKELLKNVHLNTDLMLFSNYLENPENIDVSWQNTIDLTPNKLIAVSIFTHLIYDHDLEIPVYEDVNGDGTEEKTGVTKKIQFKEVLGVGFVYKF